MSLRDAFLSPPEADSSFHGKELGGLGPNSCYYRSICCEDA